MLRTPGAEAAGQGDGVGTAFGGDVDHRVVVGDGEIRRLAAAFGERGEIARRAAVEVGRRHRAGAEFDQPGAEPHAAGGTIGFEIFEVLEGADDAVRGAPGETQSSCDRVGGNLLVLTDMLENREPALECATGIQAAWCAHFAPPLDRGTDGRHLFPLSGFGR